MLGKKWLAVRLSLGLVIGGAAGCAHGGQHANYDDATVIGGVIATVALSIGAVMLVKHAGKDDSPEMMPTMMPPPPILDEH